MNKSVIYSSFILNIAHNLRPENILLKRMLLFSFSMYFNWFEKTDLPVKKSKRMILSYAILIK